MPHRSKNICASRLLRPEFWGRHTATLFLVALLFVPMHAQRKRPPGGGRVAIVVDERLAVLRDEPSFSANIVRRMGRGRTVSVLAAKRGREGVTFLRVAVTRRTRGWVQSDAVVSPAIAGDDRRLYRLISGSEGFDRIERASIFLEMFPRSRLRPAVLMVLGEAADAEGASLSRAAERRLDKREMESSGAPLHSYYLNFSSLDRYRRQGVGFTFDAVSKRYRYDGVAWREILRRYPHSPEAAEARRRLSSLTAKN